MVLTCFDELLPTKGIALMRGDLISNLHEDEGLTLMTKVMDTYLKEPEHEVVRQFNHDPNSFNYEEYIQKALVDFATLKRHQVANKADKLNLGGPKAHYGHKTDAELNLAPGGTWVNRENKQKKPKSTQKK